MSVTFTTVVRAMTAKATTIPVPAEAVAALGTAKKPRVVVTLNGYSYRSTVQSYGGEALLPFSAEDRKAAGVEAGDEIEVTLELDSEPRTVEVPDDLAAALGEAGLREAFDALSYSARKLHVGQVEEARSAETRARRIATVVAKVGAA